MPRPAYIIDILSKLETIKRFIRSVVEDVFNRSSDHEPGFFKTDSKTNANPCIEYHMPKMDNGCSSQFKKIIYKIHQIFKADW